MTSTGTTAPQVSGGAFIPTRWTVVLSASDPTSPHAAAALETLCRAYWYRECLKEEIAHTVASPGEMDEELRHLFRVLARR